jgi:hypothetical protein
MGSEPRPQFHFRDLPGCGMRHLVDEHHIVRYPPFRYLALEVCQDALSRDRGVALGDHHEKRALIPFGMRKPDSSRFGDTWTAEREIFELDRRDPFTTGFDDILCPIDDLHIAMRVDRRHVASVEPALRVECRCSLSLPNVLPSLGRSQS